MSKKQKNILLVTGFLFVLFVCYKLAFSKTFEQKNRFNDLYKESQLLKNAPKQLSVLKQKNGYYDSLLTKYQLDGSSIQNSLLNTINSFADGNNLNVVSFLEPHVIQKNDLTIKTYEFIFEGNYNEINELIYLLEQKTKFGEIVNLHFEKKKNYRTGRFYLQASVLLKSFG